MSCVNTELPHKGQWLPGLKKSFCVSCFYDFGVCVCARVHVCVVPSLC